MISDGTTTQPICLAMSLLVHFVQHVDALQKLNPYVGC